MRQENTRMDKFEESSSRKVGLDLAVLHGDRLLPSFSVNVQLKLLSPTNFPEFIMHCCFLKLTAEGEHCCDEKKKIYELISSTLHGLSYVQRQENGHKEKWAG